MNAAPIHIAGERLMLDPSGVLIWPAMGVLAVSDLHLEKASSYARHGQLLPPYDTAATLERLAQQLRAWRPRTVIALGDSFHDAEAASRLSPADAARLTAMTKQTAFIWIQGNHDPEPPAGLPGTSVTEYAIGNLLFRHEAIKGATAEICGHHHPKARVPTSGGAITRPCFVTDGRRLMLPAFGTFTGGLDVGSPAIASLFPRGGRAFLTGQNRLFSFPLAAIRAAYAAGVTAA